MYKRTIMFHDAENKLVISELEIITRNGYPKFTMCNERNGSGGQTEFKPKDGYQNDLNNIWGNYHLKKVEDVDNFILTLDDICNEIESEEESRFEDGIEDWDNIYDKDGNLRDEVSNLEDEKIIALGIHLGITPTEAHEDIENYRDCNYSYSGMDYLVCTDEEADDLEDEYLDDYIEQCLDIPKHLRNYFDEEAWKRDARMDGRGHSLNRYNGCEDEETVNDTTYYIYRQ